MVKFGPDDTPASPPLVDQGPCLPTVEEESDSSSGRSVSSGDLMMDLKLVSNCNKHPKFSKAKFSKSAFVINHSFRPVEYESVRFVENNRDSVVEEQVDKLRGNANQLVQNLFLKEDLLAPGGSKKHGKKNQNTVGSKFQNSLKLLTAKLKKTTPHFIRCIKPNDSKEPLVFDPHILTNTHVVTTHVVTH